MLRLSISFLLVAFFSLCRGQSVVIVKNNAALASIVVDPSASQQVKNAAKVLQYYIQQSTGVELGVANSHGNNISIHVGRPRFLNKYKVKLGKLSEDGFLLQSLDKKNILITGKTDWGTEYGVYEFLERYLGIHWLMPTTAGTVIPKLTVLSIPTEKIEQNPVFLSRQLSPVNISANNDLGSWGRINRIRSNMQFHHNLLKLFSPEKFGKTNPEFYSTIGGKKHIPANDADIRWQPNFSAPGIVDTAAAEIISYFKKNPNVSSFSLGINDTRNFDQTPASKKRRSGRKNFLGDEDVSDDYFRWVNAVTAKVSKVFPDKKFGLLAYNNVAEPPLTQPVNSTVVPYLTYERLRWANMALERTGKELTQRWGQKVNEIGWYDYVYGDFYLVPRVWFHKMQKYLIWGSQHKVRYYYGELYPNWGEGPKPWVLTKLLWNPRLNVDSLLNVWYEAIAGKAAAPYLKQYYELWENFWTAEVNKTSGWNIQTDQFLPYYKADYLKDVPASYITSCDSFMNTAYSLAEGTEKKELVGKLGAMWRFYKACILSYQSNSNDAEQERLKLIQELRQDPLFADAMADVVKTHKNIDRRNWNQQ